MRPNFKEEIELLIAKGADINAKDSFYVILIIIVLNNVMKEEKWKFKKK